MLPQFLAPVLFLISINSEYIAPDYDGFYRINNDKHINSKQIAFTVLGDWGGFPYFPFTTPIQYSAARLLSQVSSKNDVNFNLAIGDNFYYYGVESVNDKRWWYTYENMYKDKSLQVPWYPILGNHDWQGNVTAQVEYSRFNQRWTMPDLYYTVTYTFDTDIKLTLIMIDTQIHCEPIGRTPVDSRFYPKRPTEEMRTKQLAWLENELKSSNSDDFLLIVGHYGIHYETFSQTCMKEVDDLLKEYNSTAYINGHHHQVSHFSDHDEPKMNYLCSGYGALTQLEKYKPEDGNENKNIDINFLEMTLQGFNGGIMLAKANKDEMLVEFFHEGNKNGAEKPMHSLVLKNRNKK